MKYAFFLLMVVAVSTLADHHLEDDVILTDEQRDYEDRLARLEANRNLSTTKVKCENFNFVHNSVRESELWRNGIVPYEFGQLSTE